VSADDMVLKISDFGLSLTPEKSTYVSQTIYSSPEMIFEESFDANTDVWTLGCILYELAELRFLFFGTPALVEKFAKETVHLTKDRYSEMLHTVITKCLTYDSAKRPTSAQLCQSAILQKTIIEQGVVSIADVRSVYQDGDDVLYIEKPQELE
jgi:NIMA (never in mitosis gene a)-related kinase